MIDSLVRFLVRLDDALEVSARAALRALGAPLAAAGLLAVVAFGVHATRGPIALRGGGFVRGHGPEIYRMEGGARRRCVNWATFTALGGAGDLSNVTTLSPPELARIPDGPILAAEGTFIKASGPEIYLVERQARRWITNWPLFLAMGGRADLQNVAFVSDRQLATLPVAAPIR